MRSLTRHLPAVLLLVACTGQETTPTTDGAAAGTAATEEAGPVLAEVQGLVITARDFEMAAAREAPADGDSLSDEQKAEVLDKLITERMLYLEAKKAGIDQDPKVQKVMVNTLLRRDVYSNVRSTDFTPDELRAYYEEHREEFVVPEKVQVRQIYIKAGDQRTDEEALALATDLYQQVVADPDSFHETARENSEDPYRRRGGDLGFISREGKPGIDDAVIARAFEMQVGDVSEPFLANNGYHVLLISARRERVERTFEQMKGSVLRRVKNDRYKELYDSYVGEIRPGYAVTVHEDELSALDVQPARRLSLGPGARPSVAQDTDDVPSEDQ